MKGPNMTRNHKALIVTMLVLTGATIAFLATNTSAPRSTATRHARTTPTCDAGSADTTIPGTPPADLAWKNIGAFLVPTSPTFGPTRYTNTLWSCYRHDPMGAVLASYVITAGLSNRDWRTVAQAQIVPGPGQKAFIQAGDQQAFRPPQPGQVAEPVGFQVVTYTPQQATIDALADAGDGQYQVEQNTVAWTGGDWKLVVTPDGRSGPDPQLVSSASGFVLWGGQGG
jgi:hypothetical protein